jgi:hypothetical protein
VLRRLPALGQSSGICGQTCSRPLRYEQLNPDVLPLYIVLMGVFPPVLADAQAPQLGHARIHIHIALFRSPAIVQNLPSSGSARSVRSTGTKTKYGPIASWDCHTVHSQMAYSD